MRTPAIIASAVFALLFMAGEALAQVRVEGYFRKDGTYVRGHYRSAPLSVSSLPSLPSYTSPVPRSSAHGASPKARPYNPYQRGGSQYGRLGPRGGVYNLPGGQGQGLLPAPRSAATRVLDSINGFMEKQKAEKATARKEFYEFVEWADRIGWEYVDKNKAARLARKAGIH